MAVMDTSGAVDAPAAELSPGLAARVASQIRRSTGVQDGFLAQATEHVLAAPGKLLRPRMILWACQAAGGDAEHIFPAAVGTECGHIASLIHDDIIDGDTERRGRVALHVQYDISAAIVTGDLFIFQTFLQYTLCRDRGIDAERVLDAIRVLSRTGLEMCEGQALEAQITGRLDTDEETYLRMILLKTAGMCRATAMIGAILAGAPESIVQHLGAFGQCLGLAFQIMDDVLPYTVQPERLGKPPHSDVRNARITLPIIYALSSRQAGVSARIDALFAAAERDPWGAHAHIAALLRGCGALEQARDRAVRLRAEAQTHLQHLPPSEAREHLRMLADAAIARDH